MSKTKTKTKKPVMACVEQIKPGRWFQDGKGNRFIKVQDVLPSGLPGALMRVQPDSGRLMGDFAVNAIYENGCPGCCPYGMPIFQVESEDDLYDEEMQKRAPTVRHINVRDDPRKVSLRLPCAISAEDYHVFGNIRYMLASLTGEDIKFYEVDANDVTEAHARILKYKTQHYAAVFYVAGKHPSHEDLAYCEIVKG